MSKDLQRREQAYKCGLDTEKLNFNSRPSLSMRRKHLKIPGEENKHLNCALDPKDHTFQLKIETFKLEINP